MNTSCSNFDELVDLYGIVAALNAQLNAFERSIIDGSTSSSFLGAVLFARTLYLSTLFLQLYHIYLISQLPILRKRVGIILAKEQLAEFAIENGLDHTLLFLLHLQLLNHFPHKLAKGLSDFVLIAVGIV